MTENIIKPERIITVLREQALSDGVAWVFVGIVIGIPLGVVAGWILAQVISPKPSTVLVQRTDEGGYLIVEK